MSAQFTIPLVTAVPGMIIASSLWNNEWGNLNTNFIPAGMDSYSNTDVQMQIQTAPYPGSVTSHASSLGGELERIRYQMAAILGTDFWYKPPEASIATMFNTLIPIGGSIKFPSATPPNANFLLRNGQAISRTVYAALFGIVGTTYGTGDGTTTFNIPNDTDRMTIGAGNLYALGATGGAVSNTPTLSDLGHNHTQNSHTHTDSGHTHSTPNVQLDIDYTLVNGGSAITASVFSDNTIGSGAPLGVTNSGVTGNHTRQHKNQTKSGGAGTSGSGTADISSSTATNLANTTGITCPAIPTLSPYLADYWMMRVL